MQSLKAMFKDNASSKDIIDDRTSYTLQTKD